jgi:hypothetical protein
MSLLPKDTYANANRAIWAEAGSGGGSTSNLQSPASITPAVLDGSAYFNFISSTNGTSCLPANPAALITVYSTTGNIAEVNVFCTGGGNSQINMGNITGVTLEVAAATANLLEIINGNTGVDYLTVDTSSNVLTLGNAAAAGTTTVNTPLTIQDGSNATGLVIAGSLPFVGVTGVSRISNNLAANGVVQIGTSVAKPVVIEAKDSLGSASVTVGGNGTGLADIVLTGGPDGGAANITTTTAGAGQMSLGASAVNPQTVFIRDGATANSGYVDITGGTSGTDALRLRGYQAGGFPIISTNRPSGTVASLTLTPGTNDVTPAMTITSDGSGNINTNFFQTTNFSKPILSSNPWIPQVLRTTGVASGTFDVDLTQLPSGWAVVYGFSTTPLLDRQQMFSVMVYTDATSIITGGGIGGVPGLAQTIVSATNPAALQVQLANPSSANYSILGMTLLGG